MDKLIDLLNEYERSKGTNLEITKRECVYGNLSYFGYGNGYSEFLCISKRYGFIQRLVENDKIDRDKTNIEKSDDKRYDEGIVLASNYDNDTYVVEKYYSYIEQLLMILSIQDNPIEYLCSILK